MTVQPGRIQWRAWDEAAFAAARDADRPVLLSINTTWCAACHGMDDTAYSHDPLAAYINKRLTPIRVDADRRPDVNARYNMGGWPTTAVLTPEGDVVAGATFVPQDQLMAWLDSAVKAYERYRAEVRDRGEARGTRGEAIPPPTRSVDASVVAEIVGHVAMSFDRQYGGFGGAPKFPHADAIDLLLDQWERSGDEELGFLARAALDALAGGALWDHGGSGFFRYAENADWTLPHYEKLLEDNARLLLTYARAAAVTGEQRYHEVARGLVELLEGLRSAEGPFRASYDSDEPYYKLGAEARGEWAGPSIDEAVFASWNGTAIQAYLAAADHLNDAALQERALAALDQVVAWLAPPEAGGTGARVLHVWEDGRASGPLLLLDHVAVGHALTAAYAATKRGSYLDQARALAQGVVAAFWDDGEGGFFDLAPTGEAAPARLAPLKPLAENAAAVLWLAELAQVTGEAEYRARALAAAQAVVNDYRRYGLYAAGYGRAVARALATEA